MEKEWTLEFHGVTYIIFVYSTGFVLKVDIEQTSPDFLNSRWSGEFSAQYIEEITQKAGNFKKFPVFVKMLCSAFSKESESVFVDLLTYNDLEMLKARKSGGSTPLTASTSANPRSLLKRYVILTYTGEFDRVHFPLPINHEDTPNVDALQRTIRRLRHQLEGVRSIGLPATSSANEPEGDKDLTLTVLKRENTELRHRLRLLEARTPVEGTKLKAAKKSSGRSPSPGKAAASDEDLPLAYRRLRLQYETTKTQLAKLSAAFDRVRRESANEVANLRRRAAESRPESTSSARPRSSSRSDSRGRTEDRVTQLQSLLVRERNEREREREANRRAMRRLRREFDDLRRGHYSGSLAYDFRRQDTFDIGGGDGGGSVRRSGPSLSTTMGAPRYAKPIPRESERDGRGRTRTRARQPGGQVSSTSAASSSPRHHRQQRDRQRSASSMGPGRNWSPPSANTMGGPSLTGRSVSLSSSHRTRDRDRGSDLSSPAVGLRRRTSASDSGQPRSRSASVGGYSSTGSRSSNRSGASSSSARSDKAMKQGRVAGRSGDSKGRGKPSRLVEGGKSFAGGIAERRAEDREWDEALFRFSDPILHTAAEETKASSASAVTAPSRVTRTVHTTAASRRPTALGATSFAAQDFTSVSESLLGLDSSGSQLNSSGGGGERGRGEDRDLDYRSAGSARKGRYSDNDSQGSPADRRSRTGLDSREAADIPASSSSAPAPTAAAAETTVLSTAETSTNGESNQTDVSDIDRRIQALQSFLDRARAGILGPAEDESKTSANS